MRRRYSASTLRACAASTAAQPVSWARISSTSRAWGYGARGSSYRSSPSSQIATRPRSRTGANAAARVPITTRTAPRRDGQERAVALRRAGVGAEHDVSALAEPGGQRRVEPVDVAVVGDADQRARDPATRWRRRPRPGARSSRRRAATVQTARGEPPRPAPSSSVDAARVVLDAGSVSTLVSIGGRRLGWAASRRWRAAAGRPAAARRSGCRRTSRRRRRSARRRRASSTGSALTTRRSGCSRPVCSVVAARSMHEPVDVLAGEAHLDPHPGLGVLGHRRRDGVVEGPVEVGERHVDQHPRDRVDLGRLDRLASPWAAWPCGPPPGPARGRQQLELVLRRPPRSRGHAFTRVGQPCASYTRTKRTGLAAELEAGGRSIAYRRQFPRTPGETAVDMAVRPRQQPAARRRGRSSPR